MQEALPVKLRDWVLPGHFKSQVESESQLTEHVPSQVTWHVDPAVHEMPPFPSVTVQIEFSQLMLPLTPVESVHVLPPLQFALHEPSQVPLHVLPSRHASEQLWSVQFEPSNEQVLPAWQMHSAPWQTQAGPGQADAALSLPQPATPTETNEQKAKSRIKRMMVSSG